MRKEKWLQWILGTGIVSVLLGIALFAQRGSEIFSFEQFRSPQFLLRDPSMEDRPQVEVVSSPVVENEVGTPSLSGKEAGLEENPALRLQPDLATRPILGLGGRTLPSRLAQDHFRETDWRLQEWVPFYRDRHSAELRLPVGAPVAENVSESPKTELPKSEENSPLLDLRRKDPRPSIGSMEVQSFPALSFSDSKSESLQLRPMDRSSMPAGSDRKWATSSRLSLRESEMSLRDSVAQKGSTEMASGQWKPSDPTGDRQMIVPEGAKFKGREAEVYASDEEREKAKLSGKTEEDRRLTNLDDEEHDAALAKQNKEAKEIERRVLDDRRFLAVADRDILYSEDGRGRLYAPGYRVGSFDVNMDLSNRFAITDNYRYEPEKKAAATVSTTPTVEMAAGERDPEITDALYMAFRYTPSLVNYINIEEKRVVNQEAVFNVGYRFSKLSMVFNETITTFAGGDTLVGGFLQRNFYTTSGSVEYELSEKTSMELSANIAVRDYLDPNTFDSQDSILKGYVNYSLSEKVRLGLGAGLGYLATRGGSDQTVQDALVRGVYFFSAKSTVFAESGMERRQFDQLSTGEQYDGVFRAGGNMQLFPKTNLEVDASRRQIASGISRGTNYRVTGLSASVLQDVGNAKLVAGTGMDFVEFRSNIDRTEIRSREESTRNLFFKLGGRYSFFDWWDIGVDYIHREKIEKESSKDTSANEFGINSKVRF